MAKRKIRRMSPELKAMLSTERNGPIKPRNRYDERGRTMFFAIDTSKQLKLFAAANRILAKAGYFQPFEEEPELSLPEATMIGSFGLRPIWHGRP